MQKYLFIFVFNRDELQKTNKFYHKWVKWHFKKSKMIFAKTTYGYV